MDKKIRKTHQSESEQKQSDKNQDIPDLKKTQRRARRTKVILSSVSVKQKIRRIGSNRLKTHHSEVKIKSIESKKLKKSIKVKRITNQSEWKLEINKVKVKSIESKIKEINQSKENHKSIGVKIGNQSV